MKDYWNHNAAYHPWVLRHVGDAQRVLDVGCGEGLLVLRLAARCGQLVGIDTDPRAVGRARERLAEVGNASVELADFMAFDAGGQFDAVVFVAVLHHLDTAAALRRAVGLPRPGGRLVVVGLAAVETPGDWLVEGLRWPAARLGGLVHREAADVGVAVARPRESLAAIRGVARQVVPGARVRRGLYYRYLLTWRKPA